MSETGLHCRVDDDGRRYIEAVLVPWDEQIEFRGRPESFAPGSLRMDAGARPPVNYAHDQRAIPVGFVARTVDTAEGLWGEIEMLDGDAPLQAWSAADRGVVTGVSVEFNTPGRSGPDVGRGRITDATLHGLALTTKPAYRGARITAVRARTPKLDEWMRWRDARKAC